MSLSESDRTLVTAELGREPTPAESALFENLWSEHCAYRSSWPLLSAFDSESERVVVGPGDDAAVVALPRDGEGSEGDRDSDVYVTLGIESHNHPSYVDPYDGAATGVGGIVRDTLSMGAYPIALTDSLYFGNFDREHTRYLLEGVVEGISDYGNSIGVPTVGGSVSFHPDYVGNPLVNVACVGLLSADRLVTAAATEPGNALVLVGNATGRDGLGGASFASEDLAEDAETEDRPAVQVGDPYTEKLLIEANEALLDEKLIEAARDLGAAGLGGASSEMVAKGGLGCEIGLDRVHQREPNMSALEILLAESQERMCYEVRPENVDRVLEIADRFDLGSSVIGEVTDTGRYVCNFEGSTVVDVPGEFLADGAPMNDLEHRDPPEPAVDRPDVDLSDAFEAVLGSPNASSRRWVYRQYDHEVGVRTAVPPGDDAAVLAIREAKLDGDGLGLALSAGAEPNWTSVAPYEGARAVALENATNLAAVGARPLAAVDCLNGGNPENPEVYGGFRAIVDGLADMCAELDVPVVGGNVSLYNDSASGPIPPTPTLAMVGTRAGYGSIGRAVEPGENGVPPSDFSGEGTLFLVGDRVLDGERSALGGSELLARIGGFDRFPTLPDRPGAVIESLASVATADGTRAVHDVAHGGLAVALAESVTEDAGAAVTLPDGIDPVGALFHETPGRLLVETTEPEALQNAVLELPVEKIGSADGSGTLSIETGDGELEFDAAKIETLRSVLEGSLD